jgi:hypothetical protein
LQAKSLIADKLLQYANALFPIVVQEGKLTSVRQKQDVNAKDPIVVQTGKSA